MNEKILITPRSFGKADPALFGELRDAGYELIRNETGGIMSKAQMMDALGDVAGVILGVDPMDAEVIASAPKLRAIAKYGVGVDNIDLGEASKRGIIVSKTAGANSESVADYALALMLALARQVIAIDSRCRARDWSKSTTSDVSHKTLGLFGLGAIGRHVARRAQGFSMKVLAYDPYWDDEYAAANGIERASKERILSECDFISLHLPLMDDTAGFIGADELALMKPEAVLINTARGGLIDERALLNVLKSRQILGAGIDAFSEEPPTDPDWYGLDNLIMGSHCAASTYGATKNMGAMATANIIRDLGATK